MSSPDANAEKRPPAGQTTKCSPVFSGKKNREIRTVTLATGVTLHACWSHVKDATALHAGDTAPFPCGARTLAPFPWSLLWAASARALLWARAQPGSIDLCWVPTPAAGWRFRIPVMPFFRRHRRHADIFNLAAVIRPRTRAARSSTQVVVSNLTPAAARAPPSVPFILLRACLVQLLL